MTHITALRDVGKDHVGEVGGKAAALGELLHLGVMVPPGFVLTTRAHLLGMHDALRQEISDHFDRLGADRVAVRSSAVAEDGAQASWAGQLESFLNVTQPDLLDAIERCWQSIKSERAVAYAAKYAILPAQRRVGVVVQAMVDSDIAGVLFTANPLTGATNQFIIEAAYGLGESVVQGTVVPDTFVVAAHSGAVVSHEPHMQQTMLVFADGQNQTIDVPRKLAGKATLSKPQLQELAGIGRRIAAHYGRPMDIEWAYADGTLYVVQARPITTI